MTFNKAFAISFLWHLFWFFAVTIVILPAGSGPRKFADVSFLGSILDTSMLRQEFQVHYTGPVVKPHALGKALLSENERLFNGRVKTGLHTDYLRKEKPYNLSMGDILESEKKPLLVPSKERPSLKIKETGPAPGIEGKLKYRKILFKPPMPDCKGLLTDSQREIIGDYYKVKLRVVVTPQGLVKDAGILESGGQPEIDLAAIRYVKKWNFSPALPGDTDKEKEGIVSLSLVTR